MVKSMYFDHVQNLCLGNQKILHKESLARVAFATHLGKWRLSWSAVTVFARRTWLSTQHVLPRRNPL